MEEPKKDDAETFASLVEGIEVKVEPVFRNLTSLTVDEHVALGRAVQDSRNPEKSAGAVADLLLFAAAVLPINEESKSIARSMNAYELMNLLNKYFKEQQELNEAP